MFWPGWASKPAEGRAQAPEARPFVYGSRIVGPLCGGGLVTGAGPDVVT